jgi:hypothetical protein
LSADRRFATAYNAALQTAKMAIACAGYRLASTPGHHGLTFEAARLALGPAVVATERSPTGIRNPVVFFRQTFFQEPIPDRPGKGNVNHATHMYMPELRVSETEFPAAKAVGVNRYLRLRCDFFFDLLQVRHLRVTSFCFDDWEPCDDSKVFGPSRAGRRKISQDNCAVSRASLFGRFNGPGKGDFIKMGHKLTGGVQLFPAASASQDDNFLSIAVKR